MIYMIYMYMMYKWCTCTNDIHWPTWIPWIQLAFLIKQNAITKSGTCAHVCNLYRGVREALLIPTRRYSLATSHWQRHCGWDGYLPCHYHLLNTWPRHQMETFSALLAFCTGNSYIYIYIWIPVLDCREYSKYIYTHIYIYIYIHIYIHIYIYIWIHVHGYRKSLNTLTIVGNKKSLKHHEHILWIMFI